MLTTVETSCAPAAIGPYSQAVAVGDMLYTSGQIPLDPEKGTVVAGGIAQQAEQVLKNLAQVLKAGGADLATVVKTTCFLADMKDFA